MAHAMLSFHAPQTAGISVTCMHVICTHVMTHRFRTLCFLINWPHALMMLLSEKDSHRQSLPACDSRGPVPALRRAACPALTVSLTCSPPGPSPGWRADWPRESVPRTRSLPETRTRLSWACRRTLVRELWAQSARTHWLHGSVTPRTSSSSASHALSALYGEKGAFILWMLQ